jgi:hypothetical protein
MVATINRPHRQKQYLLEQTVARNCLLRRNSETINIRAVLLPIKMLLLLLLLRRRHLQALQVPHRHSARSRLRPLLTFKQLTYRKRLAKITIMN